MTDVAKVGQETGAKELYKMLKKQPIIGSEVFAAQNLAQICNSMTISYDKTIEDQNDYLVDIDTSLDEISGLQENLDAQIKKLKAEIKELLKKKEDGSITEEEEAELETKNTEINNLRTQTDSQINAKNDELTKLTEKAGVDERKTKAAIAKDYGETALEKGQPLSETKDKRKSFWRKLSGGWNKQAERDAGKQLLEAGEELLDKVNTSTEIDNQITKKTKKSV